MNKEKSGRIRGTRIWELLLDNLVLLGLVFIIIFFSFKNPFFFSYSNARSILRQLVPIGIYSFPVALLLISNSIDLSLGAVVGLSAVVGIEAMNAFGFAFGIFAFLGVGLAAGLLNGVLVSYFRLNPVIITLGTQIIFRGLSLSVSGGRSGVPPALFLKIFRLELFGFRLEVFFMLGIMILSYWVLHRNRLGRYLYAAGENERAAFLMGVKVQNLRFLMHTLVGLAGGIVGIISVAKVGLSSGSLGQNLTLPVIIAILLGGIDFGGGAGKITSVIVGVFFIGILEAGLLILGVTEFLQQVIVGAVLILAVCTSALRKGRLIKR